MYIALFAGTSAQAEILWQLDFETALGFPVTHNQAMVSTQIDGVSDLVAGNAVASLGGGSGTYADYKLGRIRGGMFEASAVGLTDLTAAGTKPLALGNAPDNAILNRSFIGYVDSVRFTDETLGPTQFLNAVPEPSLAVYLVCLLGLAWFHRYRADR